MPCARISACASASVASGPMVTGIHHHARFELLDLAHLLGLFVRREVAMDDADAAGLRHGDGEPRFGHRVHGRRKDRDVELDVAGDHRADVGLPGHDLRVTGLQQHVVKSQRQSRRLRFR